MRLWSLHPKYLDAKGLVALWREGLLAQKVLQGKTKGYKNHPQLERFKKSEHPLQNISIYLYHVAQEAQRRSYHFDQSKIVMTRSHKKNQLPVNKEQLKFETEHLFSKLKKRDRSLYNELKGKKLQPHPIFYSQPGPIEEWEKRIEGKSKMKGKNNARE